MKFFSYPRTDIPFTCTSGNRKDVYDSCPTRACLKLKPLLQK